MGDQSMWKFLLIALKQYHQARVRMGQGFLGGLKPRKYIAQTLETERIDGLAGWLTALSCALKVMIMCYKWNQSLQGCILSYLYWLPGLNHRSTQKAFLTKVVIQPSILKGEGTRELRVQQALHRPESHIRGFNLLQTEFFFSFFKFQKVPKRKI